MAVDNSPVISQQENVIFKEEEANTNSRHVTQSQEDEKWVIMGSLTTPLTTSTYVWPTKPREEWTQEEIDKEEVKVRAAFMRASVDYRKHLKEMPHHKLQQFIDRERYKAKNRNIVDSYQKARMIGVTLQTLALHSRNQKESDFLDDKIAEMTKEAERMKANLEKQVKDYEQMTHPTEKQTIHIRKVKAWLEKFPVTMSNLKKSQAQRQKEMQEENQKMMDFKRAELKKKGVIIMKSDKKYSNTSTKRINSKTRKPKQQLQLCKYNGPI
jgi:hypothetical protein